MEINSRIKYSRLFVFAVIILSFVGIAAVTSAGFPVGARISGNGNYFFFREIMWYFVGAAVFIIFSKINYRKYLEWQSGIYILGCVMFLAVAVFGAERNGAKRWLSIAGMSFQPSEVAKVFLIITIAVLIYKYKDHELRELNTILTTLVSTGVYIGFLLYSQKDFGTTVLVSAVLMTMLFAAGIKKIKLFLVGAMAVAVGAIAIVTSENRMKRIMAFFSSGNDEASSAIYQLQQSIIALGSGGLFGSGYGNGKQKYYYLPEPHTDFIFASLGEEIGFIGLFLVAVAFITIFSIGMSVAMKKRDNFAKILVYGLTMLITTQALINMCVAIGLFPTKGMALPFLSFGGSAIIGTMMSCGIILNIIKEVEEE